MRWIRLLAVWLLASACGFAQQDEKKLLERILAKPDMSQINPMNGKKFDGGGFFLKKPAANSSAFGYDQKISTEKYGNVRSFLGLKNPWIGKRIYDANTATVWSKTLIANGNTAFPVETAKTQKFYQADRKAARREDPVRTSPYLGKGSSQGRLDQISDKIDKNMTIEQVREILNKNQ
jgi:hypothetical protein